MAGQRTAVPRERLDDFATKLHDWGNTLDPVGQAMLIDLLAKAGGDVYGVDQANRIAAPEGSTFDSSALSPLESLDFRHAVAGIFEPRADGA
ncbi:MAG TPA: hypothetical protein VH916_00425 [Dehalococcoidia bacterium]